MAFKELTVLAAGIRGGPGGLMIGGWAAWSSQYAGHLSAPYNEIGSMMCVAFMLVGGVIMTFSAVRSLFYPA
ncbi:hypothetical protein QN224_13370 [Sinorhizobium sp. 8-89]|uniref:hypothetical protein n=1 Tax=Sinorhizobium sp. 7-81 TaxID=3049087 RepID=UPI0024C3BF20|nr:hypothetical protein [Sinorhizobium sp. 7-81]MDK1386400.1 hypothetical protein [Sinorhizobium sp. 7-81]